MSSWPMIRLADVTIKVGSGATPRGGEASYKASGTPLIRSMNVHFDGFRRDGLAFLDEEQAAALKNVEVREGDVLLNITGASIGRVTIAPAAMDGARVNQHVCIIRSDGHLAPSFLRWHLASPQKQRLINSVESGATRQALTKEKILGFEVPLPSPSEQQAIVAEIEKQFSRLDEAVAGLQRVKANLKRYKAAVLKSAVAGRLVETEADLARREGRSYETGAQLLQRILDTRRKQWQGKGKYKEPAAPDTTDLPELPEGWVWAGLIQLSDKITDGTHHTPTYLPQGVAFLSVKDIREDTLHFDDCKFISQAEHDALFKRCNPERDDVLITKSGTIGRTAIVITTQPFSLFVSVALIKPVKPHVSSRYLKIALDAYIQSIDIAQDVKGGLLKNLHLEDLRQLPIQIPPSAEQRRIVAEVDRLLSISREAEAEVDANLKRAQALRQATLQQAFSSQ